MAEALAAKEKEIEALNSSLAKPSPENHGLVDTQRVDELIEKIKALENELQSKTQEIKDLRNAHSAAQSDKTTESELQSARAKIAELELGLTRLTQEKEKRESSLAGELTQLKVRAAV